MLVTVSRCPNHAIILTEVVIIVSEVKWVTDFFSVLGSLFGCGARASAGIFDLDYNSRILFDSLSSKVLFA